MVMKALAHAVVLIALASSSGCSTAPANNSSVPSSGGAAGTGGTEPGGTGGTGGMAPPACSSALAAPLRRLTQFEYNTTLHELATAAPVELAAEDIGNLFGNDVATQSVPLQLVKDYFENAQQIASSLTSPERIATLSACAAAPGADEVACVQSVLASFVMKAYRRPLDAGDLDAFSQLFQKVRASGESFASSLAAVLEAALQAPDFLYRPELGVPAEGRSDVLRPTDYEMATRLSYLFWGSQPDDELLQAAAAGQLRTPEQVKAAGQRLLADDKSREVVRYFFDFLLPIQGLSGLQRDTKDYPAFNAGIGQLMRQEAETFLLEEVFGGSRTWPGILTAPYTYANAELAAYYGLAPVTGTEFRRVPLDGVKRAGLLSLGGVAAGPVHTNKTNPVTRGALVVKKLMCQVIPLPPKEIADQVKPPADDLAPTARERYTMHSAAAQCRGCHVNMDPVGFALEKIDAVGQWREQENGVTIDATGNSPLLGTFDGPVELGKRVAESEIAQACFARRWVDFGYGRTTDIDSCGLARVVEQFKAANYDIQQLLLSLTQTDDFLYLPLVRP